jgi:tRNA nucleotidyltransferase/poly(A) polymerase
LIQRVVAAVVEHQEATIGLPPPFLADLAVPGQESLNVAIEKAAQDLADLDRERAELERHKLLIGRAHGQAFENLVIDELNLILRGSDLLARDVEEVFVEDFELAKGSDRVAIGEAKGVNRGVSLGDVNQVNDHRTELFDAGVEDLPGLLVVNTFRGAEALERREEIVHERVCRHARRMNVLVLRSWDLYQLVVRRLNGKDDAGQFAEALQAGGGWFDVGGDDIELR